MNKVLLGDILTESNIESLSPNPKNRITVRLNVKGVEKRPVKNDTEGATKYYTRSFNQFIYGKQNLFKGAFGIIPKELDGFETSSDLPCFDVDINRCKPEWILFFFKKGNFYKTLEKIARGAGSKRISPKDFFKIEIPLPSLDQQEVILNKIFSTTNYGIYIEDEIFSQQNLLKKLRQSILQEAIEGKLTAQWRQENPDVEPASKLLEKIRIEKERLIKEKKSKKEKPLSKINENEAPFALPDNWEWVRLGHVIDFFSDYHANGSYEILKKNVELLDKKDYAIMLRTTNFHYKNKYNYKYINEEAYHFLSKTKLYPEDIIMNKIADPGKVFFVQDLGMPMSLAMNLFLLRFDKSKIAPEYVFSYLNNVYDYIVSFAAGSSTLTITKDAVKSLLIPLPPLQEQKVIVEKIESFFVMCDELEQHINESKANAEMLMQAVLKEAFEINQEG